MTAAREGFQIPGITIEAEVGRGAHTVVYRARRDGVLYAVKVRRDPNPSSDRDAALMFRREAALLACFHHPAVPRIVEVDEIEQGPYIVMEYVDGETLAAKLDRGALSESEVVEVARALAGALGVVHENGLVHRDLKPQNVLIDKNGAAKLIDFGFAVRMRTDKRDDESVVGTFLYCAPEQSGMLNRALDGRADLYSLGVVLYECATGTPPFQAADVGELIRQHAVETPASIAERRPEFSPALAAVIAKLLAKDPDDRYQSAKGLLADLEQLERIKQALENGHEQPLGRSDLTRPPIAEPPLVGRERELARLVHQFGEVRRAGGSIVLLEGAPGYGKSRLARELVERLRLHPTVLFRARCSEGDPAPFAAIRGAIDELLRTWKELDDAQSQRLYDELRHQLDDVAPLLRRVSPALAEFVGDVPDLPSHLDLHEPFFDAIAQFILRCATAQGEGLILVDDAQWIDEASLHVLRRVHDELPRTPLMILLACQSDSETSHTTQRLLQAFSNQISQRVGLSPLGEPAIAALISAQLGGSEVEAPLIRSLVARTDSSPFAVNEFLRAMLDEGLLRPSWGHWIVDHEALDGLQLPSDVIQLVVRRISELSEETQRVLRAAAVMGTRFNIDWLPALCPDVLSVYRCIGEATRMRLIEQSEGSDYRVVHDRVREALIGGLDPESLKDLHQQVADVLELMHEDEPDTVFRLARHYAQGRVEENAERAYQTNIAAGLAALENFANDDALGFLDQARRAAELAEIPNTARLDDALATVCTRTRRFDEAIVHLERAIAQSETAIERAGLWRRLAQIHGARIEPDPAFVAIGKGFAELDVTPALGRTGAILRSAAAWLARAPERRFSGGYKPETEPTTVRRLEILSQLYEEAGFLAFFRNEEMVMLHSCLAALRSSFRLGPSRELVNAFCNYAALLAMLGLRKRAKHYVYEARNIALALDDRSSIARAALYEAWVAEFSGEHREAEQLATRALERHTRWIDGVDYVNAAIEVAWNLELRGYTREAWSWIQRVMERLKYRGGDESPYDHPHGYDYAASLLATLGRPSEALNYLEENEEFLARTPQYLYAHAELLAHRLLFHVEQGEVGEPIDAAVERFATLGLKPGKAPLFLRHFFIFHAYARALAAERSPEATLDGPMNALAAALVELRKAATVPLIEAHLRVLEARYARLSGDERRARRRLSQAQLLAESVDSPWVAYEIARERGLLLLRSGNNGAAAREARLAHELAVEHGWTFRARHVRAMFQLVSTSLEHTAMLGTRVRDSTSVKLKRHLDALMQVSLASASVLEPDVQARVALDEIVKILGAERAFLFWEDGETGELELRAGRDARGNTLSELRGYSSTVVERVRANGEPLIVSGTDEGAILGSESAVTHDLRSIVAVPLKIRDRHVGVVYLDNRLIKGIFTEDDVEILAAIAGQIAIAQDTARSAKLEIQYETERQRRRLAEILRDLTSALNATLNLDDILERLLDSLAQVIPHQRAIALLRQGDAFRVHASRGYENRDELKRLRVRPADDDFFAELLLTQTPICIDNTAVEPVFKGYGTQMMRSWLGAPLISSDEVSGAILLAHPETERFSTGEADIAATFCGQAVIAIENARLFSEVQRLAITDELTGTHNRRHFFTLAEREIARARRYQRPLSLLMIDVDHFKSVNDTYGHDTGDDVLKTIAARLRASIRDLDVLARFGGEEFVILLPEIDDFTAESVVAERLRQTIDDTPVSTSHGPISMTISIGVAAFHEETHDVHQLVKAADNALYGAKSSGRNRVMRHEDVERLIAASSAPPD
ncbi:MAG: diguanylate cyclase [Myxococcales bacterium]|nr:diguanylate cyclase [Myxococcales bacterium]